MNETVEIEFNKEAYEKTETSGDRRIKIVSTTGRFIGTSKKLTMNRDKETNSEYPYAIMLNSGLKDPGGNILWRKYCISKNGRVLSLAKNEREINKVWDQEEGEAFMLLPVDDFKKYLDTL